MKYLSVSETAEKWGLSERTVRNYCAHGRVPGAFITGKTWNIPEEAVRPMRINGKSDAPSSLLEIMRAEMKSGISGGIYHEIQIDLTYNSNHIEGSRLTHDQTRYIFETNTIGIRDAAVNVDDIVETANHFRCIDTIIEDAGRGISEAMIKRLHFILKNGTSVSRKNWFAVGEYKKLPNAVGGFETALPENVASEMKRLIAGYNSSKKITLEDIIEFHYKFEMIHPFQDGNGRVGRLLMFKECLRNDMAPFIIDEDHKMFYYRGLKEWKHEKGYLIDTCLSAQDEFKKRLDYFRIKY